tara:strand:+ start:1229 stop:1348 length:120 start_codon:yes stop_codon:yes gene_type:complete
LPVCKIKAHDIEKIIKDILKNKEKKLSILQYSILKNPIR